MKLRYLLFLLSLFLIFQSCTSVTFEEPQPSDEPNLENIPAELRGKYLSLSDSSVFTVGDKLVTREYLIIVCDPLDKLDSLYNLTNDTFLVISDTLRVKAAIINDTVCARFTYTDTIFNMSTENVLRKYKGNYFMNMLDNESWEVMKIEPHKNRLYIGTISSKEDVRKLRQITETADTTITVFKPTPVQFKKFVRKKGFGNKEVLKRME